MMKKIWTLIIICLISVSMCFASSSAVFASTLSIGNTDVIFDDTCILSDDVKQHVAESLVYGNSGISTYGLSCTIFGHNSTTEYITTVTHYAKNTYPKCFEEIWELEVCSKCGETLTETRISYCYINCCL